MDVEQLFQTIRGLPVRDRLRLVERVVHELADTSSVAEPAGPSSADPSPVGLFADDPDEVNAMMAIVMENRRRWKLRSVEGEQGPA